MTPIDIKENMVKMTIESQKKIEKNLESFFLHRSMKPTKIGPKTQKKIKNEDKISQC